MHTFFQIQCLYLVFVTLIVVTVIYTLFSNKGFPTKCLYLPVLKPLPKAGQGRWFFHRFPKYQSLWFSTSPSTCWPEKKKITQSEKPESSYVILVVRYLMRICWVSCRSSSHIWSWLKFCFAKARLIFIRYSFI